MSMSRTESAIERIRRDHSHGRITVAERAELIREATRAATSGRDPHEAVSAHARKR